MELKNICSAFVKAQAEIEAAVKDKKNPAFRSTYADLLSVVEAIKPALAKHALGFIQEVTDRESGGVYVETVIIHESGEQLRTGKVPVPAVKADPHGYGSAITYGKRYSLMAAFGVPQEDDDGNAAVASHKAAQQPAGASENEKRIRKVADDCIALHAKAEVIFDTDGDTRGYWEVYERAATVVGEDKLILWGMLKDHSKVRTMLKEYAGYAAAEAAKKKVPA